ncbi:MAG: hypothetical protein AB9846_16930 [Tenuifilaceae bacterium]
MKNLYDSKLEEEMINNLKSLEVDPPDGLWNDIENSLQVRARKRIFIITSWASAATIALLFTIGSIYMMNKTSNEKIQISKNVEAINKEEEKKDESGSKIEERISSTDISINKESTISAQRSASLIAQNEIPSYSNEAERENEILPSILQLIKSEIRDSKIVKPERIINLNNNQTKYSSSLALSEDLDQKTKKDWIISASAFPVYSFHTAGAVNKAGTNHEMGIVSWGGSMAIRRSISSNLSLETGLVYNILGQQENDVYLVFSDRSNTEVTGYPGLTNTYGLLSVPNAQLKVMDIDAASYLTTDAMNNSSFDKVNAVQQFRYLELPIVLHRKFLVKGLNLNVKVGFSGGFLIGNSLEISNSTINLKGKTLGVDNFVASSLASIGILIPVAKNIKLNIEPTFRLGLNSLPTPTGKSYPFSTYVKFGLEIPLK